MVLNCYDANIWVSIYSPLDKKFFHLLFTVPFIPLKELARNPPDGVSVGLGEDENIFHWDLFLVGPPDTLYEGGFFNAKLDFPADFPNSPPTMTFKTPIWHPNG
jgi:hypothetical protein